MNRQSLLNLVVIAISLGLIKSQDTTSDEKVLRKYTESLNNFRRQMSIEGMRRMYWDDELTKMAQTKAESCDKTALADGNEGSFSIGLGHIQGPVEDMHTLASSPDSTSLIRNTLDRRTGVCRDNIDEATCKDTLQVFNPKVWLIGCAINYQCEAGAIVACVMNRRMNETQLPMRRTAMPECTESFTVGCHGRSGSNCYCELKDPDLPRNLPEDEQELPRPNPGDSRSSDAELQESVGGVDNSACSPKMYFPAIFLTSLLVSCLDSFYFS